MRTPLVALGALVIVAGCGGRASPPPRRAPPPAVFSVEVPGALRASEVATGFAAGDGRVVTVDHVLAGSAAARVGGRHAAVLARRAPLDLAALAVPGVRGAAPRTTVARAGAPIVVRVLRGGVPHTLRGRVLRPITAHVRAAPGARALTRPALELAVAVQRGDSGAPVLDAAGRLVGVVFAQATGRPGVTYAVAASALPAVLG